MAKKSKFGNDGWSSVFICLATYSSIGITMLFKLPMYLAAIIVLSGWITSAVMFAPNKIDGWVLVLKDIRKFFVDMFKFELKK